MIKHILFDFGGVLVDLDWNRANRYLGQFTKETWEDLYRAAPEMLHGFETGRISGDEFLDAVKSRGIPEAHVKQAWNVVLVRFPKHRVHFLKILKERYSIYLYSNINVWHIEALDAMAREQIGMSLDAFRRLFHGTWFSNEMGHRKPDPGGFEVILKETGIRPEETLFIDDTPANVATAQDLSFQAFRHDPRQDITNELTRYLHAANAH